MMKPRQGRDVMTGRFSSRPQFESQMAALAMSQTDSTASLLWSILQRVAPKSMSVLQGMAPKDTVR